GVGAGGRAGRVVEVTTVAPAPVPCDRLLEEAVVRAQDGDRDGLAAVLSGAGPAAGLGLAPVTAPLVARFARLVKHPGRAWDGVRHLVPELPSGVAAATLAGTPRRPWDEHPADRAIAGTVLLAGLLNLLGRKGIDD